MKDLHLTKSDFVVEWFSGTGKGGQHRNKHQNCCRITYPALNLSAQGTSSRSRIDNQRAAFTTLARRIVQYHAIKDAPARRVNSEVIRNYHAERNEVYDKASGMKLSYKQVVTDANLALLIDARRMAQAVA